MFSLNSNMTFRLCQRYVKMNNGINGLYQIIKTEMPTYSPVSGDCFCFFSKNRSQVKILKWDGDGFLLYQKRLERGTFEVPVFNPRSGNFELKWESFQLIMQGISLESVRKRSRFKI